MTVPNGPNWDSIQVASLKQETLVYCSNDSIHVFRLTLNGFCFEKTVNLGKAIREYKKTSKNKKL